MRNGRLTRRACLFGIGAGVTGCLGSEGDAQEFEMGEGREEYELNPEGDTFTYINVTHAGGDVDREEFRAEMEIKRVEFGDGDGSGVAYEPEETVVFSDETDSSEKRIFERGDIPSRNYENGSVRIYGTVESLQTSEGETDAIFGKRGYIETGGSDMFEEHDGVGSEYGLEFVEADDSAEHGYEYEVHIVYTGYGMIPSVQIED